MSRFLPGIELSRLFYREAIAPLIRGRFPGLRHSAGLLGPGSEVLGFDSERSTDHEWGPRALVFLGEDDLETVGGELAETFRWKLPRTFRGYPTHFAPTGEAGISALGEAGAGPINHKVHVVSVSGYFRAQLGLDPREGMSAADWLSIPQQRLLELTSGEVFHDGLGQLIPIRTGLAYYPRDVWLYVMAAQWQRIAQQEAFVGRAAEAGDDLGSRLSAASLVRDLIRLCFAMERRYWPYAKWLGTAFSRLDCAVRVGPHLDAALAAASYPERERRLCAAYELVAGMHSSLGITPPLDTAVRPFFGRPYRVIFAGRFAEALLRELRDPEVRGIPVLFGAIDQITDSTDLLGSQEAVRVVRGLYREV